MLTRNGRISLDQHVRAVYRNYKLVTDDGYNLGLNDEELSPILKKIIETEEALEEVINGKYRKAK